jgi:hypothetical protein
MLIINRELAVAFSVVTPSDSQSTWSARQPTSPVPPEPSESTTETAA